MYSNNPYNNDLSPTPWERKYALLPKNVNGTVVWLDYYYRRMVWSPYHASNRRMVWTQYTAVDSYIDQEWRYEYGTLLDVLKA